MPVTWDFEGSRRVVNTCQVINAASGGENVADGGENEDCGGECEGMF